MNILILGANGFIGRHMAVELSMLGYSVTCADIVPGDNPTCIIFDPEKPDFAALFRATEPDVCVNCTGAASVPDSFKDPLRDYSLNTLRIIQMLEAIRATSPQTRFVHLSSAAVYGNPAVSPIPESAPIRPVSPYGWHKHYAEELCREYASHYEMRSVSLRIFSAYGQWLRKQIFWDVFQKARQSNRIELFGTGNETRDFIYVADIAACVHLVISKGVFDGRAINVASGNPTTIREAVSTLLDALGWRREIAFSGAARVGDPFYWQADISYLQGLGFKPAFSIKDGLDKVAQWLNDL